MLGGIQSMREIVAKWKFSDDYIQSYWRDSVRHKTVFRRWIVPVGILFIVAGGAAFWLSPEGGGTPSLPWVLMFVGAVELSWHFFDKARWFKSMRTSPQANGEVELRFTASGITHAGPTASGRIEWRGIEDIVRANDGLFLSQGRGLSIYVPFSSLVEESDAKTIEDFHLGAA
jgi:hypothetical protein